MYFSSSFILKLLACIVKRPSDTRDPLFRQPMSRKPRKGAALKLRMMRDKLKLKNMKETVNSSIDSLNDSFHDSNAVVKKEFSRLSRNEMVTYLRDSFSESEVLDCLSLTDQIDNGTKSQMMLSKTAVEKKFLIKYSKARPEITCNLCGVPLSRTSHVKRHMLQAHNVSEEK